MKITIKQIEVFIAVAKTENMTLASEAIFLTQSACSMALSTLENQLGGLLFDRFGKKLVLNDRGRAFFLKAIHLLDQVNELQNVMLEKKADITGSLIVGASTTIGAYVLPIIIGNFMAAHPQSQVNLNISNTEQVIQQLLKFNIDVGMIEGNCFAENIEVLPWRKDDLIVIAAKQHPLANKRKITPENLIEEKWVLREAGSGTREKFEEALTFKIKPFLEFDHTEAIKQAVVAGLGISCLSKTAVSGLLDSGQLVELKTPFLKLSRDFFILLHKEKYQSSLLKAFLRACG